MMKILPQIVTTFLAVGATFIAAYLIYLYSSQANIDEKIQIKGSKIVSLIKKAPTYKLGFLSNDLNLVNNYREKYPNKSLIFIYEKISNDLISAHLFKNKDSIDRLASFKTDNPMGPTVWLYLMQKSVHYLSPSEIWWPGRGFVQAQGSLPPTPKQAELFPFGPLGVEKWSDDFQIIRNYTHFLYTYKDILLDDVQSFVNQIDESPQKERYKKINFAEWIENIENLLLDIDNENFHIQSLLRLKQRYLKEARLPNFSWITTLGILSFISGVAIPLIIIGLRIESSIPSTINIVIFITTFAFLIGSIVLVGKDVLSSHKSEVHIKYLLPLKKQLLDYKNLRNQREFYNYDIVNQLLEEKKSLKLSPRLIDSLKNYRQMVVESNDCSDNVVNIISEAIKQSTVIKSYKADPQSGGQALSIISLFSLDDRKDFFEKLKEGSHTFIVQINYERHTKDIYKIKSPSNITQFKEIESEFNKIYDNFLKQEDIQSCISKRKTLGKYRDKLLVEIIKLTGK